MNAVAIITARGGSKRIPGKNIKLFHGKPIIAYSIEAALRSNIFEEVMVSTDSDIIAGIAKEYGASIPFMRSEKTSDDFSVTADVLLEVLNDYGDLGKRFTYACCIYPTAPFVTKEKLIAALELLKNSNTDSVVPITKFGFPIWRSFKKVEDKIFYNWPEFALTRSQDLPFAYHDCGQFYFFKTKFFRTSGKLVTDKTVGMEVSELEFQDIDDENDWRIAELKYSIKNNFQDLTK